MSTAWPKCPLVTPCLSGSKSRPGPV